MMLPREKFQVAMIFLGIFGCVFGFALSTAREVKETQPAAVTHRWGAWKDGGISNEAKRQAGPWLIGLGVVAFITAGIAHEQE